MPKKRTKAGRQSSKGYAFVLKSFITGSLKELREGRTIYAHSYEQVNAIEYNLEAHEKLNVRYPTPYGYELKLEVKI